MLRTTLTIIFVLLIIYGALCTALYLFQRSLIYFPQPRTNIPGTELITLKTDGINLNITRLVRNSPDAVIYFGGNAEDTSRSIHTLASAFPDKAIYAMHYRGYGGSEGKPTEKLLVKDAIALFDSTAINHNDIIVIGRSLGSGIAIQLASQRSASRLILVTPYDSIQHIAMDQYPYFPVKFLLQDKFESWKYARELSIPTTIITAELDEVIAAKSSKALFDNFPSGIAKMRTIQSANHNSVSESNEYINALASDH